MARRRSRTRAGRYQKAIAVILLCTLIASGLAFYAAANSVQTTPQPTQQSR